MCTIYRGISIWNFKDSTPEKFNISLAYQDGKVIQTTTFHDQKFSVEFLGSDSRVRYLTRAFQTRQIPAELSPTMILEIIDRSSSFAVARLQAAKYLLSASFPRLYALTLRFQGIIAPKKIKKWGLKRLKYNIQSLNILAGLVVQTVEGLLRATSSFIAAVRNSIEVAEILEFPRIPGMYTADKVTKKISRSQNEKVCEEDIQGKLGNMQIPVTAKVSMQDAHFLINDGLKELNSAVETCKDSLVSLTLGRNVRKSYLRIVKSILKSMESLQMNHSVEFGTLLMTLACNVTVMKTMETIIPALNASLRRKIIGNISGLGSVVTEYQKIARKIRYEAIMLAMGSIKKLREIHNFENNAIEHEEL